MRLHAGTVAVLLAACASAPQAPKPGSGGSPEADARLVAALRATIPQDPIVVGQDPYPALHGREAPRAPAGTVCGVRFEPDRVHYRLSTFPGEAEARAARFAVTHAGGCGACSTLQDLAVYVEKPDLTAPVRRCGMLPTEEGSLACIEALGFTHACARIWFFNARHTKEECLAVCLASWAEGEPSTGTDGKLNACLQCDEDRSGPVFKLVAGRTRRNSGLRSSIARPDEEVAHVVHDYVPEPPGR
jgi:hypothetical protein